jgi:hypothetical protein
VNDNPPVFSFPEYTGFVTEDDEDPLEDQQVFLVSHNPATIVNGYWYLFA